MEKLQVNVRLNWKWNPWCCVYQTNVQPVLSLVCCPLDYIAPQVSHQLDQPQLCDLLSQYWRLTGYTSLYVHQPGALVLSNGDERYSDMVALYSPCCGKRECVWFTAFLFFLQMFCPCKESLTYFVYHTGLSKVHQWHSSFPSCLHCAVKRDVTM